MSMALPVRRGDGTPETTRWDPFSDLDRLSRNVASYLDSWRELPRLLGEAFVPLADVEETDEGYVVEIELPGVKKDDVDIQIAGRRLTVSGERKEKERVGILRRRERVVGRFQYEVTLPGDVDDAGVEAHLDEGVLAIRVPKPASERPRRIQVH
ncbi:MAG: Hsp20/alpha crystallin family protein [Actinomycetota bacterium]|nr:Hsp20/alpha crystallin family protein [Actinomycetota bacterium]